MRLLQGLAILLLNGVISQSTFAYDFSLHTQDQHFQKPQYQNQGYDLLSKSAYLFAYQLGVIYGLTKCPEDWTNWDHEEVSVKNWLRNWPHNVGHAPVRDHDPGWVNYVGHPWSGMGYYVMARQTGYDRTHSFIYSVFESTVVWEYGVEALVEQPSVQDLFITPIVGSLWGELNYRMIQKIENNGGKLNGSQTLGSVALVMLSPFNSAVVWTRQQLRGGRYYTPQVTSNWSIQPTSTGRHHGQEMVLSMAMQF